MYKISFFLTLCLTAILVFSVACAKKLDDAKISSEVQNKFSQDSGLSSRQLTVQASNGVVTLAGVVGDDAQRQAASRQAASVPGVKQVINNLQVGGASSVSVADASDPSTAPVPFSTKAKPVQSSAPPPRNRHSAAGANDHYYSVPEPAAGNDSSAKESSAPPTDPPSKAPAIVPVETPPPPAPPKPSKVTIEQGTQMTVRLVDSLDTEQNQVGDTFHATLNAPLSAPGGETIPAGTDLVGHITDLRSAGKFAGQSLLVLQLDSIAINGQKYDLQTDQYRKEGASRGKNTAEKVGGGAIIGGIIGAIAGGGKGAAIGSAAGAGVGGGAQAASKAKPLKLPSETVLNFTLQAPLTVNKPQDSNAARPKLEAAQ